MRQALQLTVFVLLILGARCADWPQVFINRGVYFVDGDCYARMTRVRTVWKHPGRVIRHHDFENYPDGVEPHTTAPLDYLVATLAFLLKPFSAQPLDVAGAFVSPVLGVVTGVFLWFWCGRRPYRGMTMLLYAVSPILVHGTSLGRPDHQALLIALLSVALGAEWKVAIGADRLWMLAAGGAWGMALWVSLYEPLVLLVFVAALWLAIAPRNLMARERLREAAMITGILLAALAVERLHFSLPDRDTAELFSRWRTTIGELAGLSPFSPVLFGWLGLAFPAAPVLLLVPWREPGRRIAAVLALFGLYLLTLTQSRWGYFLALAYAMSLPWQADPLRLKWAVWTGFVLLLWPVWREWDGIFYPSPPREEALAEARADSVLLRDVAQWLQTRPAGPIVASWWQSPALAYWSGYPAVAGTSHESLPGIADCARFYTATDPAEAEEIVRRRHVRWVIAYDADRVLRTSLLLLGREAPERKPLASVLFESPHRAPPFLRLEYANASFKVFEVIRGQ